MLRKKMRKGFTLIELSLSLVFIGILSLSIVLIINDTAASYRRGMTLNHINTVGMDLVDDFRSAVQNSSARSVGDICLTYYPDDNNAVGGAKNRTDCAADNGQKFVSVTRNANVTLESSSNDNKTLENVPVFGAFCTGTYSYIWNSGYFSEYDDVRNRVSGADAATLRYTGISPDGVTSGEWTIYGGNDSGELVYKDMKENVYFGATEDEIKNNKISPFRILKIRDEYRGVCASTVRTYDGRGYSGDYNDTKYKSENGWPSNNFDISQGYGTVNEEPVELILTDDYSDLVLYDLEVADVAESSTRNNSFYAASFILGTIRGGVDIMAKGQSCKAPNDAVIGFFDYCAINKFNFAVQANGSE